MDSPIKTLTLEQQRAEKLKKIEDLAPYLNKGSYILLHNPEILDSLCITHEGTHEHFYFIDDKGIRKYKKCDHYKISYNIKCFTHIIFVHTIDRRY
jgi:hypothetical protein